jgi:hypothetical protein
MNGLIFIVLAIAIAVGTVLRGVAYLLFMKVFFDHFLIYFFALPEVPFEQSLINDIVLADFLKVVEPVDLFFKLLHVLNGFPVMQVQRHRLTNNFLNMVRGGRLLFFGHLHPVVGQSPHFHQVLFSLVLVAETFPDQQLAVYFDLVAVNVVFERGRLLWVSEEWALDEE